MNSLFSFTDEQRGVLKTALAGHNLLLSGQAGTGKSYVVNGLVRALQGRGKKVFSIRGRPEVIYCPFTLCPAQLKW